MSHPAWKPLCQTAELRRSGFQRFDGWLVVASVTRHVEIELGQQPAQVVVGKVGGMTLRDKVEQLQSLRCGQEVAHPAVGHNSRLSCLSVRGDVACQPSTQKAIASST